MEGPCEKMPAGQQESRAKFTGPGRSAAGVATRRAIGQQHAVIDAEKVLSVEGPRRLAKRIGACFVVLLVAAFFVKPARRALLDRRAEGFVAEARRAMASQKWPLAAANLRAASSISAQLPDVIRASAEFNALVDGKNELEHWSRLDALGQMTDADRMAYARAALDARRFELSRAVLLGLKNTRATDPDVLRMVSELFLMADDVEHACQAAMDALAVAPLRADVAIHASVLQLRIGDRIRRKEAIDRLMGLVARGGSDGATAARQLIKLGRLEPDHEKLLRRLAAQHAASGLDARCVLFALDLRAEPHWEKDLRSDFIAKTGFNPGTDAGRQVVAWMIEMEQFAAVIALVPEIKAAADDDLASARLFSLTFAGDWKPMERLLDEADGKIAPGLESFYRAQVAHLARRTNEAALRWKVAIDANRGNPPVMEFIAHQAEAIGAIDEAARAWETLLDDPGWAYNAAREIFRIGGDGHRPGQVHSAYKALAKLRRDRSDFQLGLAFHQLLLRLDEDDAQAVVRRGPEPFADRAFYSVTAALAALRAGDVDASLRWLESPEIHWDNARRTWRVIRIAALGSSGQRSFARALAKDLGPGSLSEPETMLAGDHLP